MPALGCPSLWAVPPVTSQRLQAPAQAALPPPSCTNAGDPQQQEKPIQMGQGRAFLSWEPPGEVTQSPEFIPGSSFQGLFLVIQGRRNQEPAWP